MRHQHIRRSATNAGYPPPPKALLVVLSNSEAAYSIDGEDWETASLPGDTSGATWNDVCYGPKGFLAVGFGANKLMYSRTGRLWASSDVPLTGQNYISCCYHAALELYFIATTQGRIYSSPEPNGPWTARGLHTITPSCLRSFGDRMIMVGSGGTNRMYYSTNGSTWTAVTHANVAGKPFTGVAQNSAGSVVGCYPNNLAWNANGLLNTFTTVSSSNNQFIGVVSAPSGSLTLGIIQNAGRFCSISSTGTVTNRTLSPSANGVGYPVYSVPLGGYYYLTTRSGDTWHLRVEDNLITYTYKDRGICPGAHLICASD